MPKDPYPAAYLVAVYQRRKGWGEGKGGHPSPSPWNRALALITAARTLPAMELRPGLKDVRRPATLMHPYVVLGLLVGVRTEEARALCWYHVDLDGDSDSVLSRPASCRRGDRFACMVRPRQNGPAACPGFLGWR